jgi:hypothetical protein
MTDIQRKDNYYLETVDEFDSFREAREMLTEYRIGDPAGYYYLSQRACNDWREG